MEISLPSSPKSTHDPAASIVRNTSLRKPIALSSLLPHAPHTNQAADRASKADDTIIQVDIAQCRTRNGHVADIRDELNIGRRSLSKPYIY